MDEMLSRKQNGAVNVGNIDLILPVRVRTRAEDVGRTPGPPLAPKECSQCVARNGRIEEASQRYSEGWRVGLNDVRVPAPVAKHEIEPPLDLPGRNDTGILSGYSGAWRHHLETRVFHPDR